DGTIHTQALTGTELAIGAHTNITLTNNPTLVSGAIYSVAFAGTDAVGNNAIVVTNTNVTFDNTLPTVTSISYQTPATSPTNATSLTFQVIFSEAVLNVNPADFTKTVTGGVTSGTVSVAVVNASTYNVTVPTVAGNGTVRLDVLNTATITDAGGSAYASNFTTGQIYSIDQTPPVFSATAPTSSSIVSDARVSYTLSEALASGSITWTRTGGTADGTIHTQALTGTELAIGAHTNITLTNNPTLVSGAIYSVAFAGTDAVGNAAIVVTHTNVTYTVDSQAPIFAFNPLNGSINFSPAGNITITFDEAVRKIDNTAITTGDLSTLVELKLTNNAGALVPFSATIDGTNRIITVNPTSDLNFNTVYYVEINPVEDASNNATVAASITFTTSNAGVPVITAVAIPNSPMKIGDVVTATISVNSDPAVLTLPVGSTIAGFALSNLVKTNNTTYTAQFTVASGGSDVPAGSTIPVNVVINGSGGNSAPYTTAITQANDPIDVTVPTVLSINYQTPVSSPTNATSLTFRVMFSEAVVNVAAADFTKTFTGLTSGTISVSAVNTTTYNITVPTVSGSGTAKLDVLNTATINDVAGNNYSSNFTTGQIYAVDQTAPVISATAPASNSTVSDTKVSYTLSEAIASGTVTWTRTGGSADGTIHTQTLTGTELTLGPHSNITLTNNPTLVNAAIYSVAFAGIDAVGNAAIMVTNTNITFAPGTGTSNLSDIVANNSFNYPQNIDYISFQETNNIQNSSSSLNVAKFDIRDGGPSITDPDLLPTIITGITLDLGSNYTLIRRIALYDESGTAELAGTEKAVTSQQISFSNLTITCGDNNTASFTIRISFLDQVTDNQQFSITITAATTQAASSGLASANGGGAVSSTVNNSNRIEVIATKLKFIQQPSTASVNVDMTPPVSLEAVDANENRDLDFSGSAGLTSQGLLDSSPTVSFASGLGISSAITFGAAGVGLTLTTTNTVGLADATSSSFDIEADEDPEGIKPVIHAFITPNTADDQNNVLYIENIELYPENRVQLINRWGVTVKSWINFSNYDTDDSKQADFDFTGLSVGNYICVVEYANSTGGDKKSQSQMISVLK
ncbi:MAG TPA: Ig-like domain-containing protein, partial [Chryseolinea sp.]|nr:Ig-like domain-containing protein [Chryseolinea sp.]